MFGLLGRANNKVILSNKGGRGDDIPNMVTADEIVNNNPLPEPIAPAPVRTPRGRGRPCKRRRRQHKMHEV